MRARRAGAVAATLVLAWVTGASVTHAGAEVQGAVIVVSPSSVSTGEQIRVDLIGWPEGVVTASVCGNAGRRGSTDCDQIGGGSIRVGKSGTEALRIDVLAPPVGCPCVVRASTTQGDVVRTAPIEIAGVPGGVDLAPATGPPDPRALRVSAQLVHADVGWPESWYPAFAGPSQQVLELKMQNTTDAAITGLRVVGAIGHSKSDEGEPVGALVPDVPAHTTRTARIPITLAAPVFGDYVVRGSIYGPALPIRFSAGTSSEPWALELALPLALLLIAQLLRARDRRRARALAEQEAAAAALDDTAALPLFPESSPGVGDRDLGHWDSPSYHHASMGTAPNALSDIVDLREQAAANAPALAERA